MIDYNKSMINSIHLFFNRHNHNIMIQSNFKPFLIGVFFTTGLFSILSFNSKLDNTASIESVVLKVSPATAEMYKDNYASIFPNKSKGISISLMQWKAINQIVNELEYDLRDISGFRFYHGLKSRNSDAAKVSMIYTLDHDVIMSKNVSYKGSSMVTYADKMVQEYTDDCPPFCD